LTDSKARLDAWGLAAVAKEQCDGTSKNWNPFTTAGLQRLRLAATYVDVGESGDAVSEPEWNNAELPGILCAAAWGLLLLVLALASKVRETLDVQDVLEPLPDDLTGADLLGRVFPGLGRVARARPGAVQRLVRRVQGKSRAA